MNSSASSSRSERGAPGAGVARAKMRSRNSTSSGWALDLSQNVPVINFYEVSSINAMDFIAALRRSVDRK